jgi:integrase
MDISNDEKLIEWFENNQSAVSTRRIYHDFMKMFCELAGKTPTELILESIQELKQGLLPVERKSNSYIAKFKKSMGDKKYSPKTFNTGMASIRSFYKCFDIPLSNSSMRMKKAIPIQENQTFLSKEEVTRIIVNTKNLREKAIILMMATSGLARQEIINLKIKDITFDANNIGTIAIRRQKVGVDFITFMSPEAVIALRHYWLERNTVIPANDTKAKKAIADEKAKEAKVDEKPITYIKSDDDFVFVTYTTGKPIAEATFAILFNRLGNQLGYGNGDGYIKSHSHAFRKYFATTLENAGMPKNKIDFMLGHTPSGTDSAYFKNDPEKLKEMYINYIKYITFEKQVEIRTLSGDDAKILQSKVEELEAEAAETRELLKEIKRVYKFDTSKTSAMRELKQVWIIPEEPKE